LQELSFLDELWGRKRMLRIRYQDTEVPEIKASVKMYVLPDGRECQVRIDEATRAYVVVDAITKAAIASGMATSMHKVKIAAKEALEAMGVKFDDEKRKVVENTD
jgi:hypothetical protein